MDMHRAQRRYLRPPSEKRSPRQQSGTEVGVLTAITGHGPTPPEGGTSRRRSGDNSTPLHYCLLIRQLLIHVLVVPQGRENTWIVNIFFNVKEIENVEIRQNLEVITHLFYST
ncbi:hypothetical protein AVEN_148748-1 [Araneus ventricosus]|uniref:Uncharacterized protein n=1 Tax=Araneus ventricosus TaxID=182803 RepID=A0A4Y2VKR4_ARAVE|nr:hypothetical protein AVEN_148748-1 [Araneus ventricosus]